MATANKLQVLIASGTDQGSRPDSGGMTIIIPTSADSGQVVKFDAQYWRIPQTYVATDVLYLSAYNSDTKRTVEYPLTYTGNLWEYTPDSTHFDAAGIRPGYSDTWTAQFLLRSDTGTGAAPIAMSDTFTLTVKRAIGISPAKFGTLAGWWDAWDLTSNTSGSSTVATWSDKSGLDRDITEGTNKPTYYTDVIGRPMLRFDGTNDVMATTLLLPANCAILMACRYKAIDATYRPAFTFGSAAIAGPYLSTTNARFTCNATHVTASPTAAPKVNETFIIGGYKLGTGAAQNIIYNHTVGTSAGIEANAAGVLKLGYDATTYTNIDIFEIWAFSAWSSGALSTITTFTGALEDAERALSAKWNI